MTAERQFFVEKMRGYGRVVVTGPIVYRLGHILLKDGSGVRFSVGSQNKNPRLFAGFLSNNIQETGDICNIFSFFGKFFV